MWFSGGVVYVKDRRIPMSNSGFWKIQRFYVNVAQVRKYFRPLHAELDSRKSERAIGEIAYENRVQNSIAFPDSPDDLFTFLKIMFRWDQKIKFLEENSKT